MSLLLNKIIILCCFAIPKNVGHINIMVVEDLHVSCKLQYSQPVMGNWIQVHELNWIQFTKYESR